MARQLSPVPIRTAVRPTPPGAQALRSVVEGWGAEALDDHQTGAWLRKHGEHLDEATLIAALETYGGSRRAHGYTWLIDGAERALRQIEEHEPGIWTPLHEALAAHRPNTGSPNLAVRLERWARAQPSWERVEPLWHCAGDIPRGAALRNPHVPVEVAQEGCRRARLADALAVNRRLAPAVRSAVMDVVFSPPDMQHDFWAMQRLRVVAPDAPWRDERFETRLLGLLERLVTRSYGLGYTISCRGLGEAGWLAAADIVIRHRSMPMATTMLHDPTIHLAAARRLVGHFDSPDLRRGPLVKNPRLLTDPAIRIQMQRIGQRSDLWEELLVTSTDPVEQATLFAWIATRAPMRALKLLQARRLAAGTTVSSHTVARLLSGGQGREWRLHVMTAVQGLRVCAIETAALPPVMSPHRVPRRQGEAQGV